MKRFEIKNKRPFRFSLGERGEVLAWGFLERAGYRILERNYRCSIGEIDLVAEKDEALVFVEVKTRSSHRFGPPEESVTPAKQRKLARLAECYLQAKKIAPRRIRFDVLAITYPAPKAPLFRLIENAFSADDRSI